MPIEPGIELTKEAILKRVTQEQIFEAYLGLPVDTNTFYSNPLRLDKNAGCRFYYNALGKLYFNDFGKYHWDCFAVVQYRYGDCRFIDALKIIVRDFNLNGLSAVSNTPEYTPAPKLREVIKVKVRDWNKDDLAYWQQYNISPEILKIGSVHACEAIWFNSQYYACKPNDPCYCYYFGRDLYKLYFPKRKKGEMRFFQNIKKEDHILQGMHLLPEKNNYMILTKGYKDVLSMYSFGIVASAVLSEYQLIEKEFFLKIKAKFPNIITLFDNDTTGRNLTAKYRREYETPYLTFPRGWDKDFSDNVKTLGVNKMIEVIDYSGARINIRLL